MNEMVEIENLSKQYQEFSLDHISFSIPGGSIMGFIGQNGAGKTTTIKLILNLVRKDSGTVKLFGLDHLKSEREIKEQIGVVLDEACFYDRFTAGDVRNIMRCMYQNWDDQLFSQLIKKFKLSEKIQIKEFSKGMKMKLSIAAALSHHPKLLILDEATSGLDPVVRNEILDLFLEFIQDESHAILLSSHITSDLEKICDYITLIHEGKLIFSESKDDLLYQYGVLKCPVDKIDIIDPEDILRVKRGKYGCEILVKDIDFVARKYKGFVVDHVSLEEMMVFYAEGETK